MAPRELAQMLADALGDSRGHRAGRHRRPGLPQHHRRRRRAGPGGGRRRGRRSVVRPQRVLSRHQDQRRVHLAPTRPARSTSGTPAGPPSATPSRGCSTRPGPRSRGSSTSTTAATRWTCSGPRWRPRRSGSRCPRTATTGPTSTTWPTRWSAENPGITDLPEGERLVAFREAGYALQLAEQQEQLGDFRTHFDVWFSERSLHDELGRSAENIEKLRGQGHLFDDDGALWMRTTDAGDDKDRVLIRSDGELTYFASDTAYYLDKRSRGFDVCIYLLGADHHGYVGRLRAMAACAGDDPSYNLEVLIGQLVKIMQDGEELKLSKRAGTIVTLEELVELIGVDALRYTLARYPADSPLTLDVGEMTTAGQRQPGLLRAVRPRPARLDPAQRGRPGPGARRRRFRPLAALPREGGRPAARAGGVPAGGGRARASCASRTGWRATSRRPPRPSTSSTTPAGCCRWATRSPPTCTAPGCSSSMRPAWCSPTASRCSASLLPTGCERRP